MELIGELERAFASLIYPNRLLVAIAGVIGLVGIVLVGRWRRWDRPLRRHPRRTAALLASALVVAVPLGWYLGSPLFLSTTVDEPAPVVAAAPSASPAPAPDRPTPAPGTPGPVTASPAIERSGAFVGADDFHFGEGTARLIETGPGRFILRLEDFAVRNGPDLFVYLSPDSEGDTDGSIELDRLKADRGNQNYEIPAGTDVSAVGSVVIWCKQFSVLFATATLS